MCGRITWFGKFVLLKVHFDIRLWLSFWLSSWRKLISSYTKSLLCVSDLDLLFDDQVFLYKFSRNIWNMYVISAVWKFLILSTSWGYMGDFYICTNFTILNFLVLFGNYTGCCKRWYICTCWFTSQNCKLLIYFVCIQ